MSLKQTQLLVYLVFGLVITQVVLCIVGGVVNFTSVPILDTWSNVIFYARILAGEGVAWWEHHNEHLIFLTRLLVWLDFKWGNGSALLLIASNYGLLLLTCGMFYRYLQQRLPDAAQQRLRNLLCMLIVAWLFAWVQHDNIVWSFQSQFFLATLLPLMAFYFLSQAKCLASNQYFTYACVTGVLALGSMANGILVLPLLVLMAMILRMGYLRILCLILLTCIGLYLFFLDYPEPIARVSMLETMRQYPLQLLNYLLMYLGSPLYFFIGEQSVAGAKLAGLGLLVSVGVLSYRELRAPKYDAIALALLMFILYVGGTALGTGGGRVTYGITQALTSRYTTPILQVWAAMLVLWAPALYRLMQRAAWSVYSGIIALLMLQLPSQIDALRTDAHPFFAFRVSMLAATQQIKDYSLMQNVLQAPEPILLLAQHPVLKETAFFNSPELQEAKFWLGKQDSQKALEHCAGNLVQVFELQYDTGYLRISGWMDAEERQQALSGVRILNQDRQVIGYALVNAQQASTKQERVEKMLMSDFQGYVPAKYIGQEIILKGVGAECEMKVPLTLTAPLVKQGPISVPLVADVQTCPSLEHETHGLMLNPDASVTDTQTKLQWSLCAAVQDGENCSASREIKFTYQKALEEVKRINAANLSAWRLPDKSELERLARKKCLPTNKGLMFLEAPISHYWTASLANYYGYYAWDILFMRGYQAWLDGYYQRKLLLVKSLSE